MNKKTLLQFAQSKYDRAGYETIDVKDYSVINDIIHFKVLMYNLLKDEQKWSDERQCKYSEYKSYIECSS